MLRSTFALLSVLAAVLPACLAQNPTGTCDPLSASNCSPNPALNTPSYNAAWTSSSSLDGWNTTFGDVSFDSSGAKFIINNQGDHPTIQTDFYIFYGYFEVKMQAAAGTGIVSSIVMLSDVNDEIDWEFTGTNTAQTQTNYFGKGYTGTYNRAVWYPVPTPPQSQSHTYAVNWTSSAITWIIDGTAVRTLNYADADGGEHFPQTPMRCKLGIWAGGDPSNEEGTIEWAGGESDFKQAPFTMTVQSVKIQNYSPGSSYTYKDQTGSSSSIEVADGSANSNSGVFAPSDSSSSSAATSSKAPSTSSKATTAAATTKPPTSSKSSSSITVSSSVETSALSTIPLQASTTGRSSSTRSGTSSRSSASSSSSSSSSSGSSSGSRSGSSSSSSGTASASSTGGGSSAGFRAAGGENALVAFVLFVLAALCAF